MSPKVVIASVETIALPAPVWLLYFFLLFTFALHVVAMSVMLGGGLWATLAARAAARDAALGDLAGRMGRYLPSWTAAAITTGVAALLFLQVLYGQIFYTASVLLAWPWLSIVGLLIAAYYGYYIRAYRFTTSPRLATWAGGIAWLLFAVIAFLYVNQMTLMLHPERHLPMYLESARGWRLHLAEATLVPRYLHMVTGAVALGALWAAGLGALALRRGDERGRRVIAFGANGFVGATLVQVALGVWFLAAQPREIGFLFVGGDALATAYLAGSVIGAAAALHFAWWARRAEAPGRRIAAATASIVVVVILMVLMRDVIRRATLGGAVDFASMPVAPQWGIIALFVLLLVAGLATVAWMVRAVARAKRAGRDVPSAPAEPPAAAAG